jgi:hypothetical protein
MAKRGTGSVMILFGICLAAVPLQFISGYNPEVDIFQNIDSMELVLRREVKEEDISVQDVTKLTSPAKMQIEVLKVRGASAEEIATYIRDELAESKTAIPYRYILGFSALIVFLGFFKVFI